MSEDSKRVKKALGAGVLGLGAAGGVAAVSESGRNRGALQQEANQVLVFAYDYNPGLSFRVVNRLQQQTVNSILGGDDDDNQSVSDPTDYSGYVVQYEPQEGDLGEYTLVFVREATLNIDQSYQFNAGDVAYFNSEVNLLQAGLDGGDGEETPTEEDEETTPEETTPEETTPEETTPANETTPEETTPAETTPANETEEVVVTTTPENGGG